MAWALWARSVAQRLCPAQWDINAAGTNHLVSEPLGALLLPGEELRAALEGSVT